MLLILLLLLMVDSDDLNVVTLLIQPPSMQSHSMDNMVRTYFWILHGVRTLDGQIAGGNTCIQMIGTSVCYISVLLLLQQFIRSRHALFFRLMMTFSSCLHGFLRDQKFQTDRIPLTDITVFLNDKWALWPRMNGVDLRNDKSGSADLLTSATDGSLLRIYDGIPLTTTQTVKLQTVLLSLFADIEQQCRQLQEIRTCQTSESRQPLLCNSLSATSFTLTSPTRESSSSSSPVDCSQPLHRESLGPSGDAGIVPPPDVALSLTMRYINGVSRCVVFTGSEDPCCSCSWSTRGSTSLALIPPTLVDSGTGGRRLRVSDRNRSKFRYIRLGRMTVCVQKCRMICSQLRKSDARPVMYRPTKPDHLQFQKKSRCRSCCPVLLCSSPSTWDVVVVTSSPHMKMCYFSSPIQRDDYSVVMSA